MKRRLSSLQTPLTKIVFPVVWISLFGSSALSMFFGGSKGADAEFEWMFLLAWLGGSVFIYWSCMRLKEVSVDDEHLYVSNYIKKARIPLSQIYDVTENVWLNIHPVTIHLKTPSEFGDRIIFMPKSRLFAFFSSHPVVAELKELARSKSTQTGTDGQRLYRR